MSVFWTQNLNLLWKCDATGREGRKHETKITNLLNFQCWNIEYWTIRDTDFCRFFWMSSILFIQRVRDELCLLNLVEATEIHDNRKKYKVYFIVVLNRELFFSVILKHWIMKLLKNLCFCLNVKVKILWICVFKKMKAMKNLASNVV